MRANRPQGFLLWIGIPLVILAALELSVRWFDAHSEARMNWYQGALEQMAAGGVDHIFIGTSRTATGIRADAWEDEIEKVLQRDVVCLNLGRAFSGPVANAFGLRELISRYPERMRNCTVLIEMSAGLPAFTSGWDGPWFYEGNTQLLVDYMRTPDLARFLRTRQHGFEDKAGVLARYAGRPFSLVRTRRRVQQSIEWRGLQAVRSTLVKLGAREASAGEVDLPENRQLRVDAGGVRLQREIIQERVQPEELQKQTPLVPWSPRVICEVAADLRLHGVPVVFYDVPVPAYVWTINSTSTRLGDREAFDLWARGLGIEVLQSGMALSDEDFPDLSHLRASLVDDYTRALARSWLSSLEGFERTP